MYQKIDYREEIDTLRSIAILTVLVFHFFPSLLPLGYLGVDMFFVISGFLISSYIIIENKNGTFSFRRFYMRRIKRILPATTFVLFFVSLIAIYLLTPYDLKSYFYSLLSTLTFTANIFFWRTGGYFGSEDDLKPLLHMWSLGVEEQFYLIFPLLLFTLIIFLKKLSRVWILLILIALFSFLLNIILNQMGGSNPAFFLLPTRVWHFILGTLSAIYYLKVQRTHSTLSVVIALSILTFGYFKNMPFLPSGTIVSLMTAYLLCKNLNLNYLVKILLKSAILRGIGKISFSLYLWHWPFIAFSNYYFIDLVPSFITYAIIVLVTLLSIISYYLIEVPFKKKIGNRNIIFFILTISTLTSVLVLFSNNYNSKNINIVNTISKEIQTTYKCDLNDYYIYGEVRACKISNTENNDAQSIALIGNSHAQMYVPSLLESINQLDQNGILISMKGCLPTLKLNISPTCYKEAENNYNSYINDPMVSTVIIGLTYYEEYYSTKSGEKLYDKDNYLIIEAIEDLITKIEKRGKEVYLIAPIDIPKRNFTSILSRKLHFNHIDENDALNLLKSDKHKFEKRFRNIFKHFQDKLEDNFITPSEELCDRDYCYYGKKDIMFFSDSDHLGKSGAAAVNNSFINSMLKSH